MKYHIATALLHLPPKGQQAVRYSNKSRGQTSPIPNHIVRPAKPEPPPEKPPPAQIILIPAPPKSRSRDMHPLRREEIEKRRRPVGVLDRNPRSG
jgi:hypothetical protein